VKSLFPRIIEWTRGIFPQLRALGPYMAIELILPGGSLIALGLWLYQHRHQLHERLSSHCAAKAAQ
jgi:hypothetical protein